MTDRSPVTVVPDAPVKTGFGDGMEQVGTIVSVDRQPDGSVCCTFDLTDPRAQRLLWDGQ